MSSRTRIELSINREGSEILLRLRDSGVGIDREALGRIFELFVQAGGPAERAQGGLGIGLTLARRLVELHGGTLTAESEGPGRGSTFTVRLPLYGAAPLPKDAAAPEAAPGSAGHRVLVVDDNVDAAESLAQFLELLGQRTFTAHSGPAALKVAAEVRPEVVFLDIGLPGLSGYEVAAQLRKEPATARVLLIAVTGWSSESDRRRSREAGFDQHLTKPVDTAQVESILRSLDGE